MISTLSLHELQVFSAEVGRTQSRFSLCSPRLCAEAFWFRFMVPMHDREIVDTLHEPLAAPQALECAGLPALWIWRGRTRSKAAEGSPLYPQVWAPRKSANPTAHYSLHIAHFSLGVGSYVWSDARCWHAVAVGQSPMSNEQFPNLRRTASPTREPKSGSWDHGFHGFHGWAADCDGWRPHLRGQPSSRRRHNH